MKILFNSLFLIFICCSCCSSGMQIRGAKQVLNKNEKLIRELLKNENEASSLTFADASFSFVWINHENNYLECYEIHSDKTINFIVKLDSSCDEKECEKYFQNNGYALVLDGGATLSLNFACKMKKETQSITVNLQDFMSLNLDSNFCLEKQFQRDLFLIFSTRKIERFMLK